MNADLEFQHARELEQLVIFEEDDVLSHGESIQQARILDIFQEEVSFIIRSALLLSQFEAGLGLCWSLPELFKVNNTSAWNCRDVKLKSLVPLW